MSRNRFVPVKRVAFALVVIILLFMARAYAAIALSLSDAAVGLQAANEGGEEEGDAVRGKEVFEKRCTGCHALDQDREGPRLRGVYGRNSGEVPGFPYSEALKKARIVWNEKSLEQWLTDPDSLVPGNNMDFHVPKAQERRDLVRFLRQLTR
jgi:cytochrome c